MIEQGLAVHPGKPSSKAKVAILVGIRVAYRVFCFFVGNRQGNVPAGIVELALSRGQIQQHERDVVAIASFPTCGDSREKFFQHLFVVADIVQRLGDLTRSCRLAL